MDTSQVKAPLVPAKALASANTIPGRMQQQASFSGPTLKPRLFRYCKRWCQRPGYMPGNKGGVLGYMMASIQPAMQWDGYGMVKVVSLNGDNRLPIRSCISSSPVGRPSKVKKSSQDPEPVNLTTPARRSLDFSHFQSLNLKP